MYTVRNSLVAQNVTQSNSNSVTLTLAWVQDTQSPTYSDSCDMIQYSVYCQARGSHIRHATEHQCNFSSSTTCTVTIEELQPDKCYNCCVYVTADPIFKLGEYGQCINATTVREDNVGKQLCDFAYSHLYERFHIYLQHYRVDNYTRPGANNSSFNHRCDFVKDVNNNIMAKYISSY